MRMKDKSYRLVEITLPNFDGASDETDNLIVWIAVEKGINITSNLEQQNISVHTVEYDTDINDPGIDIVISKNAEVTCLLTLN